MRKKGLHPEEMPEFRNDYLHLIIDEKARLMYSEWVRKPTSEEYRQAGSIYARFLQEKDIAYWIQDTNLLGEVPAEDLKTLFQLLVPIAAASNLKKLARITEDEKNMNTFMELASQSNVQLNAAIKVQNFKTYHEAAEWIAGK
jgi:hypothetical protein